MSKRQNESGDFSQFVTTGVIIGHHLDFAIEHLQERKFVFHAQIPRTEDIGNVLPDAAGPRVSAQ
jgi:hypothetical protein